jgi:amino acid adenylation domain-containing protein
MNLSPAHGFYESSVRFPDHLALCVGGRELSYIQLRALVQPVAGWLRRITRSSAPKVAILTARSLSTYLGILGSCWAGGAYVPISAKLPDERLIQLLGQIQADALVVDTESISLLSQQILPHCPAVILSPESADSFSLPYDPKNKIAARSSLPPFDANDQPASLQAADLAYIIFTSGTTGIPKGVMITAKAVDHFVSAMRQRYLLQPSDRIAGMTEITFDISVFDMFVTWSCGASLHVVPATQMMAPAGFVQSRKCTAIFTVPSVISGMRKMKMLRPGIMPTLRFSLFAGEPLPVASAQAWQEAAPNSLVDDLFGPTEATVVCIGQRFFGPENATPNRGVVAIGNPFPGMEAAIASSALQFLPDGEHGELLLGGPQLSSGYFQKDELTNAAFPLLEGKRWYRTGDLAYRDLYGTFHHLGRIDNQVKVRGLRVELEEIEAYLREICGTDSVAAVAWPMDHGSANGIVAFVSGQAGVDHPDVSARIKSRLPSYMVPSTIHHLDSLPLNSNGKVNRKELVALLDEGKI